MNTKENNTTKAKGAHLFASFPLSFFLHNYAFVRKKRRGRRLVVQTHKHFKREKGGEGVFTGRGGWEGEGMEEGIFTMMGGSPRCRWRHQ